MFPPRSLACLPACLPGDDDDDADDGDDDVSDVDDDDDENDVKNPMLSTTLIDEMFKNRMSFTTVIGEMFENQWLITSQMNLQSPLRCSMPPLDAR